ncbi:unnamed protein product [Vicia faba]|uniref:Uncharacterized protein n=1 Tax=Vicia faba TaxID=3906 RepID=A0AAV0ZMB4_VICFA|nr:unnamed protein product [Vicia faba]
MLISDESPISRLHQASYPFDLLTLLSALSFEASHCLSARLRFRVQLRFVALHRSSPLDQFGASSIVRQKINDPEDKIVLLLFLPLDLKMKSVIYQLLGLSEKLLSRLQFQVMQCRVYEPVLDIVSHIII